MAAISRRNRDLTIDILTGMTLTAAAEKYSVSRERARQIVSGSLQRVARVRYWRLEIHRSVKRARIHRDTLVPLVFNAPIKD